MKRIEPEPDLAGLPRQYAALPWRLRKGRMRILLVTSRETRRFILPKGWPIEGLKPHRVAEREALEEAGVTGRIERQPIGAYAAWKRMPGTFLLCAVEVYPLEVRDERARWPERSERERLWVEAEDAADLVDEPGLASLLRRVAQARAA
ncbi:NUDIX hydrolase [Alsobacter sp. R-9]